MSKSNILTKRLSSLIDKKLIDSLVSEPGGLSLFRMGHLLYRLISNMKEDQLKALMECYDRILACHDLRHKTHGII